VYNLVDLDPPPPTDPLTERLESLLRKPSLPDRESAMGGFALARIYEKAGRVDQAFALYRGANAAAAAMMQGSANAYVARYAEDEAPSVGGTDWVQVVVFYHVLDCGGFGSSRAIPAGALCIHPAAMHVNIDLPINLADLVCARKSGNELPCEVSHGELRSACEMIEQVSRILIADRNADGAG